MCGAVIDMMVKGGGTGAVVRPIVECAAIIGFEPFQKIEAPDGKIATVGNGREWQNHKKARNGIYVTHPGYVGDFSPAITCVTGTDASVTASVSDHRVIGFTDVRGGKPLSIWRRLERAEHRLLGLAANVRLLDPAAGYSGLPIGDIDAKDLPIAPLVIPSGAGCGAKALRDFLIFTLCWFHDYTEPEAAEQVGIAEKDRDAARKYLQRYVNKIRAWLEDNRYPDRRRSTPISVLNYCLRQREREDKSAALIAKKKGSEHRSRTLILDDGREVTGADLLKRALEHCG
jgi:hypothetical protein